jgi:hypothetical protein
MKVRVVWLLIGVIVGVAFAIAQGGMRGLVVNGMPGVAPVIEVNGAAYVEVQALARLANAAVSFSGDQIVLTLPHTTAVAPPPADTTLPPEGTAFSKDFMRAGIEEMTIIREWRSALLSAVENQVPITADWMATYRGQAYTSLRLAAVAATTDADRNAYQLLSAEFDKMDRFSNQVTATRKNMEFVTADDLRNDPLNQQILNCARSMQAMAASGAFQDDGACR